MSENADIRILSPREHEIMLVIWKADKTISVSEIHKLYCERSESAYTTIATFLNILVTKGFLRVRKENGRLWYDPIVTYAEYRHKIMSNALKDYFNGDIEAMRQYVSSSLL